MCISLRFCKHFFVILKDMAEAKPIDDSLKLEEIQEGMVQECSRFRENLNGAKARIEELETSFDKSVRECKTRLSKLTSTHDEEGKATNCILS